MKSIAQQMDNDAQTPFYIANWEQITKVAKNFHPDVYAETLGLFLDRQDSYALKKDPTFKKSETIQLKQKAERIFKSLIDEIKETKVTTIDLNDYDSKNTSDRFSVPDAPPAILEVIFKKVTEMNLFSKKTARLSSMNLATFLAIASGAGSKVIINQNNHFLNVGYELDQMTKNEKSGRSSSTSLNTGYNDASDTFLLRALDALIKKTDPASSLFYPAMLDLLLSSNTDKYSRLSTDEQSSLTDFIAVYSAEFRRSLMSNLESHRWMDDLAEVYMISAYGSQAGKVIDQNGFSDGHATTYFAVGANGSGIGVMRSYRRHLQQLVTEAIRNQQPDLIQDIENLIGKENPSLDIFHDFMLFINSAHNQADVIQNAQSLSQKMGQLLYFIGSNHGTISTYVQDHVDMDQIKKFNKVLEQKAKARADKNSYNK